jgi:hypothetical protein
MSHASQGKRLIWFKIEDTFISVTSSGWVSQADENKNYFIIR